MVTPYCNPGNYLKKLTSKFSVFIVQWESLSQLVIFMSFNQRIWFGVWKEQFPPNFSPQHNSDSLFLRSRWQRLCQSVCARLKFPLWQLTRSYLMQYSLSSCIYFIFQALQELSSHNHNHLSCNNSNLSTLHTYGAAPLDALIFALSPFMTPN